MHLSKVHLLATGATALTLGVWAAACSASEAEPQQDETATVAGPAVGSVGTGGATAAGSASGGSSTTSAGGSAVAGATAAPTVTGASAATSVAGSTGTTTAITETTGTNAVTGTNGVTSATGLSSTMGTIGVAGTTGGVGTTGATTGSNEASCATRPALTMPSVVDFESYDGATVALDWSFEFNDDGSGMPLYGGFFDNSDGSGMASLRLVGGDTSSWAVRASNTEASVWGGGIGLWLGCVNATGYSGISLAARGSTPNQNGVSVAISVDGLTAGVGTTIFVTDLFTTFELPFTAFTNENGETTNGDNIVGLAINAQMLWVQDPVTEEWSPTPGAYELVVDDIGFY